MTAEQSVHEYWEQRAAATATPSATTDDVWLRELEYRALTNALRQCHRGTTIQVLDAGCGDGYTTLRLAAEFPTWSFDGVDFSEAMIANAQHNLVARQHLNSVRFRVDNIERMSLDSGFYDAAITTRCLINLADQSKQAVALTEIARCLRPGGYYLAIENFHEGHDAMNAARGRMGLSPIPVRWHNHYFTETEFREACEPWFEILDLQDFASSYYLATRVLYSAWCSDSNASIDYNHPLHRLAVDLPPSGAFSPVRLAVLRRR